MPNEPHATNEEVRIKQEAFRSKTFRMMLEVALVFAIPAGVAVFVGKKLDTQYATEYTWLLVCLSVAFIVSWAFVIRMYVRLSKEAREVDALVAKQRKQQGTPLLSDKNEDQTDT